MNDNDTPGYMAAGFLVAAEQQRQANAAAADAEARSRELASQANELSDQLQRQEEQNREVESDYYALFNLLKAPMHVIASRNQYFARTYEVSQRELADLKVRELAFTELAIQFGLKLGMSPKAVLRKGLSMRPVVLQNGFPAEHGTNSSVSPILQRYGQALLKEIEAEQQAFNAKYAEIIKNKQIYDLLEGEISGWKHFFDTTTPLAKQGNTQAQFNLGYCYTYGIGTKAQLDDAEYWLMKAQGAGDPASVMVLHYMYSTVGASKYDEAKAEKYLQLAEHNGHHSAGKRRPIWEKEKRQNLFDREEPELLKKLSVIVPGQRPAELDRIRGRGYAWESIATLLHSCEYKFEIGETQNLGSFFNPKKNSRCYLELSNPTDISLDIWGELDLDKRNAQWRPSEWGGSTATVKPNQTTKLYLGQYHAGSQGNSITIRFHNKDVFTALKHLHAVNNGLKYGTIAFTLRPATPYAV